MLLAVAGADRTVPFRVTGLSQEAVLLGHAPPPVNDPCVTFPRVFSGLQSVSRLFRANHVVVIESDGYLMGPKISFDTSAAVENSTV